MTENLCAYKWNDKILILEKFINIWFLLNNPCIITMSLQVNIIALTIIELKGEKKSK